MRTCSEILNIIKDELTGLSLHLLLNLFSLRAELVSAASLQVDVRDSPVVEIIFESQDTHLVSNVKFSRPVEVEDCVEGARVAIKEIFIVQY